MITRRIQRSSSVEDDIARYLAEVRDWVQVCIARYGETEPTERHVQLTYTVGWEPYLRHTLDERALSFLACARDHVTARFSENGMWAQGCSARSVSAVARGHGRDNNAGMTTAVLAPLLGALGSTR